jgi:zinc protease
VSSEGGDAQGATIRLVRKSEGPSKPLPATTRERHLVGEPLPDLRQTEVCGLPAFVVSGTGPVTAGLVFRVGFVDERLPYRGLTHLVEHLTLHRIPTNAGLAFNGETGLTHTSFYIRGTPGEVAEFFKLVSFSLRVLPMDRVAAEARVLQTEALKRGPSVVGATSAVRYGARYAGGLDAEEFVLIDPAPQVQDWSRYWFNASNVALWINGDIPPGMDIRLPAGGWHAPPTPPAPAVELPVVVHEGTASVAITFPTDRSAASYILPQVVRDRLMDRLRGEEGRVYDVQADRELLTADVALVAIQTSCLPKEAQTVADLAQGVVGELATAGPSAQELETHCAAVSRAMADPASARSRVAGAAANHLQGRPPLDPPSFLEKLRAVEPDDVACMLRHGRQEAVWVLPKGVSVADHRFMPRQQRPLPELQGRAFARSRSLDDASANDALVVAEQGVCRFSGFGFKRTVLFGYCEATLVWPNAVALIGYDGFRVTVHRDEWTDGNEAIGAILARSPAASIIRVADPLSSAYLEAVAAKSAPGDRREGKRRGLLKG